VVAVPLTRPTPEKTEEPEDYPVVEVLEAQPETVDLRLPTQGTVLASRTTRLAAGVAGRITWVSPEFEAGGRFEEGEELVRIDSSDYEAALAEARATLADARLNLANEEARAEQALRDWKRLGSPGQPNDLTLRKPQLEAARTRIEAAEAAVQRAQRNLDRTHVRAPYAATLDEIHTELGSYLAPGSPVADLLAGPPYEVRLPLSLDDYTLLPPDRKSTRPTVCFRATAGGRTYAWKGEVIREEGKVDRSSRSIYLVAEVSPRNEPDGILQPGLFVQAKIEGRRLEDVYPVPLQAFQGRNQLVLVGPEDRIEFRDVAVLRNQGDLALVSRGLNPGDRVCLTTLDAFLDNMRVDPRPVPEDEIRTAPLP